MVFSVRGSVTMRVPLANSREGLFKGELVLALGRLHPAEPNPAEPKVAVGGEDLVRELDGLAEGRDDAEDEATGCIQRLVQHKQRTRLRLPELAAG